MENDWQITYATGATENLQLDQIELPPDNNFDSSYDNLDTSFENEEICSQFEEQSLEGQDIKFKSSLLAKKRLQAYSKLKNPSVKERHDVHEKSEKFIKQGHSKKNKKDEWQSNYEINLDSQPTTFEIGVPCEHWRECQEESANSDKHEKVNFEIKVCNNSNLKSRFDTYKDVSNLVKIKQEKMEDELPLKKNSVEKSNDIGWHSGYEESFVEPNCCQNWTEENVASINEEQSNLETHIAFRNNLLAKKRLQAYSVANNFRSSRARNQENKTLPSNIVQKSKKPTKKG